MNGRPPTSFPLSALALLTVFYCFFCGLAFNLSHGASLSRHQTSSELGATITAIDKSNISIDNEVYNRELFSFAPLMGHTNRHYHYYFRLMSKRTHLYTEMIPSSQILRAYKRARQIYLHPHSNDKTNDVNLEEVLEVIERIKLHPEKEYHLFGREREDQVLTLQQLVGTSGDGSVVLQLGGRDSFTLGAAATIGSAFGRYASVNLNCGCPSNAVGGRSGGCALMQEPEVVARCIEEMNAQTTVLSQVSGEACPSITVKHRLGVRQAATFDAAADRNKNDDEAFQECSSFVRTVSLGGSVSKFQVHARLGLLGEFLNESDGDAPSTTTRQRLWVPPADTTIDAPTSPATAPTDTRRKIDHKREQERAKRRARKATIQNRNVPPLRPNVVDRLADEFPHLEFVANGGIQSLSDVEQIVTNGLHGIKNNRVLGAMVGRAAINHPCSFAAADRLWERQCTAGEQNLLSDTERPTRGNVLQDYIRYCDKEENQHAHMGVSSGAMEDLRRRLIAVPFHLFMGEEGNDEFQRSLKKLKGKTDKVKASSILSGAALFVSSSTLRKCVDDCVPWDDIAKYEGGLKRGSAMQRIIY